jgi:hypothetical protein
MKIDDAWALLADVCENCERNREKVLYALATVRNEHFRRWEHIAHLRAILKEKVDEVRNLRKEPR